MDERRTSWMLRLLVLVLFLFLLVPVLVVFPLSFSNESSLRFPPSSWSIRWYEAVFRHERMLAGFRTSLVLATIVTSVTLLVSIPAAYVIVRLRPRGAQMLYNIFTAPLLLPTIVIGLAILIIFAPIGLLGSYTGIALGHLVLTVPYGLRIIATALAGLPVAVEEAAATLGARPLTVFRRVTLPLITPGIVSAAALSFLVSFDELVITLFMAGPRVSTLPYEMYRHLDSRADPLIAAVSVMLISLTLLVVLIVHRSVGLSRGFLR